MNIKSPFRILTIALAVAATLLTHSNLVSAEFTEPFFLGGSEATAGDSTVAAPTDTYKCFCECRVKTKERPSGMVLCAEQVSESPATPGIGSCERVHFQIEAQASTDCTQVHDGNRCRGYSFYHKRDGKEPMFGELECAQAPILTAGSESSVGKESVDVFSELY